MKTNSIIAAIILAVSIQTGTAQAGAAAGGASEITQIMNNSELIASVAQQANLNATALQQYITQISQLARADQNLLRLPESVIQSRMGAEWSNVAPFVHAYKASSNMRDAATIVANERQADIAAMRSAGLSPSEYYKRVGKAAANDNAYWRDAEAQELLHMQQLQKRAEAVEDLNSRVPEIDGNVKGFQHLALQAGRTQQLMIDQQMQYSRMMQIEQQREAALAARRGESTGAADDYDTARKAEQEGLAGALSYPGKK